MKKLLCLSIVIFMFFLSACSSTENIQTETETESIAEALKGLGFTDEEAVDIENLFAECGITSIGEIESSSDTATIDDLVSYNVLVDNEPLWFFTVENRSVFYICYNGVDLYDRDNGGVLENANNIHIPEAEMDSATKLELRDLAEKVLDSHFQDDVRYYDAWGIAREDNNYMAQCQISDGNMLTDDWVYGKVWFERQEDGSFRTIGLEIDGKQYDIE